MLVSLCCFYQAKSQNNSVLFGWNFDDTLAVKNLPFNPQQPYCNYQVVGLAKYVPGVKGNAIKFDGFSSYIDVVPGDLKEGSEELKLFQLPRNISIEAWVALGAYPWNWAPILTMGKYGITGFYFGIDSRGRAGLQMSDGTSTWHECISKLNPETGLGL